MGGGELITTEMDVTEPLLDAITVDGQDVFISTD